MKRGLLICCCFFLFTVGLCAQTPIAVSPELHVNVAVDTQRMLIKALDTLLYHVNNNKSILNETTAAGNELSASIFATLKGIESNTIKKDEHFYKPQLINLYAVSKEQYFISTAYITGNSLRAIFNVVATIQDKEVTFAVPVFYQAHNWMTTKVGNITYHYPDNINLARAKKFNEDNTRIAQKLGLQPEHFDFYLVNNHQEIWCLLGFEYDSNAAGAVTDGYGVDGGVIFSTMHNENFSHDTFHYYSAKTRKNPRNSAADEGVAYSWGNAYYTDDNGEMITQKQVANHLKQYLQQHPNTSLFELFTKNPMILDHQTKVRSLLSSVICDEIERRKGVTGIKTLLDCGRGDDQYFKVVSDMIGVNPANFDTEVGRLLEKYK
jgi:hypothetical protein